MIWACEYCGRANDGIHLCDGCGAPPDARLVQPMVTWQMGTGALPLEYAGVHNVRPRPRPPLDETR